jgi:hypothetical protein
VEQQVCKNIKDYGRKTSLGSIYMTGIQLDNMAVKISYWISICKKEKPKKKKIKD